MQLWGSPSSSVGNSVAELRIEHLLSVFGAVSVGRNFGPCDLSVCLSGYRGECIVKDHDCDWSTKDNISRFVNCKCTCTYGF